MRKHCSMMMCVSEMCMCSAMCFPLMRTYPKQ